MTNSINERILSKFNEAKSELKLLEEAKKGQALEYKTTGVYISNGTPLKIKTAKKEMLVKILMQVLTDSNSKSEALAILDASNEDKKEFSKLQGYSKEEWINDLKTRWSRIDFEDRKSKAKNTISKLENILSAEQLRELQFEEILKEM
jgi:hypothetical protein